MGLALQLQNPGSAKCCDMIIYSLTIENAYFPDADNSSQETLWCLYPGNDSTTVYDCYFY